jgi:hypothetical protein
VDYLEAVVAVLREEGEPLHWTRIQDLALRRGYIDPFVEPDVRKHLLAAIAEGVRAGALVKTEPTGTYALPQAGKPRRRNGGVSGGTSGR